MGFTIVLQFVFALVVTAVCALFGVKAMWSAMVGSLIAILPNAIFAIYLFASPKPAVYRFFVGEIRDNKIRYQFGHYGTQKK